MTAKWKKGHGRRKASESLPFSRRGNLENEKVQRKDTGSAEF